MNKYLEGCMRIATIEINPGIERQMKEVQCQVSY
jgi:hypothetical protein